MFEEYLKQELEEAFRVVDSCLASNVLSSVLSDGWPVRYTAFHNVLYRASSFALI